MLKFLLITIPIFFTEICRGDPVSDQILNYSLTHNESSIIRTSHGLPVPDITNSLTAGSRGPILLQDVILLDTIQHFVRERIPERVVHPRGSGAFGFFEVTKDITMFTKAKLFEKVGNKVRVAVRFSLGTGERGLPETIRMDRGFAVKFYTEDGIWDLVGYNSPVFYVRDPMLFPMFAHVANRNPVTNLQDANMQWDFFTLRAESLHQVLWHFSPFNLPESYRHMDGHAQHAFKMVNASGNIVYVKFNFKTDHGFKTMTTERSKNLTVGDPDHYTRDLYNAIAQGNFPSWTLSIQVMTSEQAENLQWNPFDITKDWPRVDFPLIEAGRFTLNENPKNYFEEIEQIAFCPCNMISGIEPSPDKLLQGRIFAYSEAQLYRLGTNYQQLPVNCPFGKPGVSNYLRDGQQTIYNHAGAPNYFPNSFGGPQNFPAAAVSKFSVSGEVGRYNYNEEDNFSHARKFWDSLSSEGQNHIVEAIVGALKSTLPFLQKRAVEAFKKVCKTLGGNIEHGLLSA